MNQGPITPILFLHNWKDMYINPIEENKLIVEFNVPGKPRGKERPRTVRINGMITTYTPKNTVEYEKLVRSQYIKNNGDIQLQNAIKAEIQAIFPIPKSTSKKEKEKMLNNEIDCTKKPDCDNIGKVILDSLNEVAYHDDSQVNKLFVEKQYGEVAQVKVKLSEI